MGKGTQRGLVVDFIGGAVGFKFRRGPDRGHALVRAVGLKPGAPLAVVDATAGLGRDAFLLASLGADVTLIERSPAMHRLLAEGLARAAKANDALAEIAGRMKLVRGDSIALLPGLRPDVVIVDPMHPPRRGGALVKQEMRQLRDLVGTDPDALALMQAALATAKKRVVLKWPLRAAALEGLRAPSHTIASNTVRYDVFVVTPPRQS
jgi:16S rRNA (guanine1516-N2)-methyltransferase